MNYRNHRAVQVATLALLSSAPAGAAELADQPPADRSVSATRTRTPMTAASAAAIAAAAKISAAPIAPVVPPPPPRAAHPFVIRADVGWNSLAGAGLRGSWMATTQLAVEAGAGYVLAGPKGGARLRWNFSSANLSPYAAVGGLWSRGLPDTKTINQGQQDEFSFHLGQAVYLQSVLGLDYQDDNRFTFGLEVGWAQALNHRDLHVVSGKPTDADWKFVKAVAGGGIVLGGSIGYAF